MLIFAATPSFCTDYGWFVEIKIRFFLAMLCLAALIGTTRRVLEIDRVSQHSNSAPTPMPARSLQAKA
jgi:hypothetical protein